MLTALREAVRSKLHYAPATGVFTWRVSHGRAKIGAQAGYLDHYGRRCSWMATTGRRLLSTYGPRGPTFEFTGLRGFSRRSGGMMG